MLIQDRKHYILQQLETNSSVTVKALSSTLDISEVTVRKLLIQMEEEGSLKRAWGGAVRMVNAAHELPYSDKEYKCLSEKQAIAHAAYETIHEGETIYLDCGTTSFELVKLIVEGSKQLIVCTNAFNILGELRKNPSINAIMIGGELRHSIYSCVGPLALKLLQMLVFDRAFVTGDHFSLEHGFSVSSLRDAEVKHAVFASAKRKYIIMDSSKYGDSSMAIVCPPNSGSTLITDWQLPEEICREFEKKGTRVIAAPRV